MSKQICHQHCLKDGHADQAAALIIAAPVTAGVVAAVRTAAPHVESAAREALRLLELAAIVVASGGGLAAAGWLAGTQAAPDGPAGNR
jgi:hypothetical protein